MYQLAIQDQSIKVLSFAMRSKTLIEISIHNYITKQKHHGIQNKFDQIPIIEVENCLNFLYSYFVEGPEKHSWSEKRKKNPYK